MSVLDFNVSPTWKDAEKGDQTTLGTSTWDGKCSNDNAHSEFDDKVAWVQFLMVIFCYLGITHYAPKD